mmetsp:Transcript_5071/g.7669  ORF Transcript_5071/g.7669 Transcript_5071/m.7669 type:complete len:89 (+) Transcript_5071:2658-2924(+)
MNSKTNQFENQMMKENTGAFKDLFKAKRNGQSSVLSSPDNFEITTQYLYYRQEILAQSIGGLNIYQVTLTKRREAGSIKHKKKTVIYI